MGKIKKGKKHSHQPKALGRLLLSSDRIQEEHEKKIQEKYRFSELQSNLNSISSDKRLHGCSLLTDIYQFNQQNQDALLALTDNSIMNALLCRLTDSNLGVQVKAATAIKILSEVKFKSILERIISQGILRTMISLVMTKINWSRFIIDPNNSSLQLPTEIEYELTLFQELLYAIGNIFSGYPSAIQEIFQTQSVTNSDPTNPITMNFLSFIFTILQTSNIHIRLINTILNVFILITKLSFKFPAHFLQIQQFFNFEIFHNFAHFILFEKLLQIPLTTLQMEEQQLQNQSQIFQFYLEKCKASISQYQEQAYDQFILLLQLIEINLNLLVHRSSASSQGGGVGIDQSKSSALCHYYLQLLFTLLEYFIQHQSNEVHPSVEGSYSFEIFLVPFHFLISFCFHYRNCRSNLSTEKSGIQ